MADDSEIKKKYAGKTVFITGGTGFLGKALIEKLLYSCEEISRIYVLVRKKKEETIHERIQQLFNVKAFERLKDRPNCLSKLFPLAGDVRKPNLGISEDEILLLEEEVSIVFNLAATVNFKETLQEMLNVNVIGTLEVIKLCHRMKRLQSLVHVSTAFSNAERKNTDEIVYPPPHSLEQVQAQHISQGAYCLGNKPNSYVYSKALAEDIVLKMRGDIPTVIIRPSVVISSLKEPCPGWIDNWNGSTGLFLGLSLGVLKVVIGRAKNITDLVPVDIVTNLTIVAAVRCQKSKDLKVYNCCTGATNPITCREAINITRRLTLKHSLNEYPWPYLIMTSSRTVYYFLFLFLQLLPAFVVDVWCFFLGKPKRNIMTQMKLMKMTDCLKYFMLHQWRFSDGNVRELWNLLSKRDQKSFNFDVRSIVWEHCIKDYIFGARKFLLQK